MQNPEEDILKRFLQDTFSDYEPMPTEQSWEHIHKAIQAQKPSAGSRVKQWIIPVVALLLLIGGVVWNTNQASDELEDKSIALLTTPETLEAIRPSKGWLPLKSKIYLGNYLKINELKENASMAIFVVGTNSIRPLPQMTPWTNAIRPYKSIPQELSKNQDYAKKLLVNETTSKEEGELLTVAKKQSEVFEGNTSDGIVPNIITTEETRNVLLVSLDEKSSLSINKREGLEEKKETFLEVPTKATWNTYRLKNQKLALNIDGRTITDEMLSSSAIVSIPTENLENHEPINDATIQEIRYVKPIETLKNKDFVISKPQFELAKINQISFAKEAKPIRRPTYISLSIMPLQTYRILTINHRDIQNLQTNNLFDAERNGFALELGMVKPIANSWNFRSSFSYLKMRQWAEYQVNTEEVSVKNAASNSNSVAVGINDNEFIGQIHTENKTLQMVGLKADVQHFFKLSGRNRYFISTGTQLMYETNEKQTNVFLNASAGFQHVVNKDLFLTVEPTASYLLYNINDSKSLIQTNAYNLGLKIGVNFRVK
jgi:hypothetical protein